MARGDSGRIVLEIDPSLKGDLYSALTRDGLTLKEWFLRHAAQYLRDRHQISLFGPSVVPEDSKLSRTKWASDIISLENNSRNRNKGK